MKPVSAEAICLRQEIASLKRRNTELEELRDHLVDTTRAYQEEVVSLLKLNSELRAERYAHSASDGIFLTSDPFEASDGH